MLGYFRYFPIKNALAFLLLVLVLLLSKELINRQVNDALHKDISLELVKWTAFSLMLWRVDRKKCFWRRPDGFFCFISHYFLGFFYCWFPSYLRSLVFRICNRPQLIGPLIRWCCRVLISFSAIVSLCSLFSARSLSLIFTLYSFLFENQVVLLVF